MNLAAHIHEQARSVNVKPTDGQKEAGNYKKGHVRVQGLDITIENPRGSYRSGKDASGKPWRSQLPHHYGYIKRTVGADDDHVDVYLGPHLKSPHVFAVDQHDLHGGTFDEHKIFIGFGSKKQARDAYIKAFSDGRGADRIGHMDTLTVDQFKAWLRSGKTKKPIRHRAAGGSVSEVPSFDQTSEVPAFDQTEDAAKPKSWTDRISNAWDKATPGGPLWMAKQVAQGVRGAVEGSVASTEPDAVTEEDMHLQNLRRDQGPERAMQAAQFLTPGAPGGGMLAVPRVAPKSVPVAPEVMANKEIAGEFGIPLSKGQATQDLDAIRYEDLSARGAYGKPAQDRAATFFDDQYGATQQAGRDISGGMAGQRGPVESPGQAAEVVAGDVGERATLARSLMEAARLRAEAEATAQRGMVQDSGRVVDDVVRQGNPAVENPLDVAAGVRNSVQEAAAANRQDFKSKYDEFGRLPGEFDASAVRGMGNRIKNDLSFRDEPVVIDDQLTPLASRAIQEIDNMSAPRIQNRADPRAAPDPEEITSVSLKGVDQMRKKLVAYYQGARNAGPNGESDRRAMQAVMEAFDNNIERSITEDLFSGDPRALQALQEARASYSRYRNTFGPQRKGDDVGDAMRRIVEQNRTPEEVANYIIGSGKLGSSGLPVRIADRLQEVLPPEQFNAVRQAIWQRASQVRGQDGGIDPIKSARSTLDFLGTTLAQRHFNAQERAAMREHAQGVMALERAIETHPATQAYQAAQRIFNGAFGGEGIGGAQQAVFRRIIDGTALPEEAAGAIFNAIGSGNPGNVSRMIGAIERITGNKSETMAAIRQGVWQKVTQNADGRSQPGMQKIVNNISDLLNGKGASIAKALYTEEQRQMMERYAHALRLTIIPKYARTNSDTAPAMMGALRKYGSAILGSIGAIFTGGAEGGLAGVGVKHLLEKGGTKFTESRAASKVGKSLDNLEDAPRPLLPPKKPLPAYLMRQPTIGGQLSRLQGPSIGRAEDEKRKP